MAMNILLFGKRLFSLFVLITSMGAMAEVAPTRTEPGVVPKAILWVGHSFFYYNNSMHNHFGQIVREGLPGQSVRSTSVTIGGAGLDWHDMESLLRPQGIGRYSFVGDNEIIFNKSGKQFDSVIMADCSQCPVHPQLQPIFHEYAKKHSQTIQSHGLRPILFMTWAYKDKPSMTQALADEYTQAGNENDALVIPAGLAFALAIARKPDLELYQADKRHPSLAGTYLAALTTFAALYGKSPQGIRYDAGLGTETARFLQQIAWESTLAYFKR
jgi:hypothetical protein